MIVSAIVGIIMVSLSILSTKVRQAMTVADAVAQMKKRADGAVEVFQKNLPNSVRLFTRDGSNFPFYARINGVPNPLTDWRGIKKNGFWGNEVGNVVMFCSKEKSMDFLLGGGAKRRIDIYRFHYIFPAYGEGNLLGQRTRHLLYAKSGLYANRNTIADTPAAPTLITRLTMEGVFLAFDKGATSPTEAFYTLSPLGNMTLIPGAMITMENVVNLTQGSELAAPSSYRIGLAPNIATGVNHVVPLYAIANADYPSGFEITTDMDNSLVVRLVLIAQGAFPKPRTFESYIKFRYNDSW